MTKLYIAGGALVLVILGAWFVIGLIEKNEELRIANEAAAATIVAQAQDAEIKQDINKKRVQQIVELNNQLKGLQDELNNLDRTPEQAACDRVVLPDGYTDRLLHFNQ